MVEVKHRPQKKANIIIKMQAQMIATKAWKKNIGMHIDLNKCRLCRKCVQGVMRLAPGCQMLAGNEYLKRHKNAWKMIA